MIKLFLLLCFLLTAGSADQNLRITPQERAYLQSKVTFKVCVDPQSSPFEEITQEGIYKGIIADLIRLVARRLNIALEVQQVLTWDDSLKLAKSGQCDIVTFMTPSSDTTKWLRFSDPLFEEPYVLITREEHPYIEDLAALTQESMTIPIVSDLFTKISRSYPNLVVIPVSSKEEAFSMVSTQKADMTVRSMTAAAYIIKQQGFFNLKIAGELQNQSSVVRLAVMKDDSMLQSLLNRAIATITPQEKETSVNKQVSIVIEKGMSKESWRYLSFGIMLVLFLLAAILLWNTYLREKIAREVAKSQAIQNKLFQASKEAEIGRIIGNISHQWRGTLAKIGALNLLTLVQLKNDQPLDKRFILTQSEEIGKLLDFMSQTMQDFLEFYKPSKTIEAFSLLETIEQARSILEPKIQKSRLSIEIEGEDGRRMVGIKNQWVHVWLNLIDNTINAALKKSIDAPFFKIIFTQDEINIYDNAGGMPSVPNESDMGLGIYMCIELVKKHGGEIRYNPIPEGLNVSIRFLSQTVT
jgi:ABC-type amino acid transport substrate-binding protein